jgi:hypothetical protein
MRQPGRKNWNAPRIVWNTSRRNEQAGICAEYGDLPRVPADGPLFTDGSVREINSD